MSVVYTIDEHRPRHDRNAVVVGAEVDRPSSREDDHLATTRSLTATTTTA